jgi:hypothetical protein
MARKPAVKRVQVEVPVNAPYLPPPINARIVIATQAVWKGEAQPAQQHEFLEWLIVTLCGFNGEPYLPNDRDTIFALGKRHVAVELNKLILMTPAQIAGLRQAEGTDTTPLNPEVDGIGD